MAKETDVKFQYIPNERYIIEIKDEVTKRSYFTKRIGDLRLAVNSADEYIVIAGLTARIFDTKTGEVI